MELSKRVDDGHRAKLPLRSRRLISRLVSRGGDRLSATGVEVGPSSCFTPLAEREREALQGLVATHRLSVSGAGRAVGVAPNRTLPGGCPSHDETEPLFQSTVLNDLLEEMVH